MFASGFRASNGGTGSDFGRMKQRPGTASFEFAQSGFERTCAKVGGVDDSAKMIELATWMDEHLGQDVQTEVRRIGPDGVAAQ